jgi:hypothetical protein
MTDLNDKLKLVASYMGLNPNSKFVPRYNADYNEQIPVWQKVCKELKEQPISKLKEYVSYHRYIDTGTPLESFEILVEAIQFINKMEKK